MMPGGAGIRDGVDGRDGTDGGGGAGIRGGADGHGAKTVLVVDDEPMLREAVADALRDEGYVALEGANGREAVELFSREAPDLVLMDVMMPTLDGREAYRLLRGAQLRSPVPVVMMSAAVPPHLLDPTIAGFLAKPFDLDQLLDLVAELIGHPLRDGR